MNGTYGSIFIGTWINRTDNVRTCLCFTVPRNVFWTILAQPSSTPLDAGDILARLLAAVWRPSRRQQPRAVTDMPDAFSVCCAPRGTLEICIEANCDVIKGVFKPVCPLASVSFHQPCCVSVAKAHFC